MKGFVSLLKKDVRLMISGKFFLMSFGFLILYTFYVNFGYVKFMNAGGIRRICMTRRKRRRLLLH